MEDKDKTKVQLMEELNKLRKRVTELEKSEQHKISPEFLSDGYLCVNLKGKITDCNSAFLNHTGYSREDIVNKYFTKLPTIRLKDIPRYIKMFNSARRGKFPKPIEYEWIHKDGTTHWGEVYFGIVRKKRRISGFNAVTRDITKRKQVEEALKTSLKTAADLIYSTPYGLFIYQFEKPDSLILLSGNPEAERLTGVKIDDCIGKEHDEIFPEANKTGVTDAYLKVMNTGKTFDTEDLYYKDKKFEGAFRIRAFQLPDEKLCVSFENITERKIIEEKLKNSEEKYRSLIETTDDLVYLIDTNYSYIFMNKKHAERFKLPFKEIVGRSYSEFHSKKESGIFRKDVNKVIRTGNSITHEHKSDRDKRFYLRTFSPVKNEKGEVIAINVISKDISDLKQTENELKRSEQEIHNFAEYLQTARENERALVASELHDDVGQALTGIKMDIFLIKNKMSKDKKEIPGEFQKMEKLLDDSIQKLRKIYSELRPSLLEHFGIGEAMRQYVSDFQEQSGTQCTFHQDPEEIILNENRSIALYRILQGSINNIKWHSQATKVNIRLEGKGPNLKLTIRDNGKGIKKEQINSGESFGLIGMRERARFLGGELEIKGLPNKGTTVSIKIPLKQKNN